MKFKTFIFITAVILMYVSAKGELKNYFSENQLWWIEAICCAIAGWRIGNYNTMLEEKKTVDQAINECELLTRLAIVKERIKIMRDFLKFFNDSDEKRKIETDVNYQQLKLCGFLLQRGLRRFYPSSYALSAGVNSGSPYPTLFFALFLNLFLF